MCCFIKQTNKRNKVYGSFKKIKFTDYVREAFKTSTGKDSHLSLLFLLFSS